jgi:hypothetical protein
MLTKGFVGEKLGLVLECTASDNHSGEKYEHEVVPHVFKNGHFAANGLDQSWQTIIIHTAWLCCFKSLLGGCSRPRLIHTCQSELCLHSAKDRLQAKELSLVLLPKSRHMLYLSSNDLRPASYCSPNFSACSTIYLVMSCQYTFQRELLRAGEF